MQTLEEQFNTRLNAFLGSTGLSPTTFGMKALGDPNLMRQIDGGTLAVAENGGPGSGVHRRLRPGLGRPSDSAPRPPASGSLRHGRGERGGAER